MDAGGDPAAAECVLAGDIGGTHARLALARAGERRAAFVARSVVRVGERATPADAIADFLRERPMPSRACIAWAGPIDGARATLTNAAWSIDAGALAARFGFARVTLVNDFHAAAAGIDEVGDDDLQTLQAGSADAAGARLVIGAGTGLGVAYVTSDSGRRRVLAGEGGHAAFAPLDDEQAALWRFLRPALRRVTAEHVLSGAGIVRLYAFACAEAGVAAGDDVEREGAAAVARRADAGDARAQRALRLFCAIYGAVAGDHALACLATGGVYVAGGIAARLAARLADGTFVAAFGAKGVHEALMARMPVRVVRDDLVGLRGAARLALDDATAHEVVHATGARALRRRRPV